jgi:hypothetical protein
MVRQEKVTLRCRRFQGTYLPGGDIPGFDPGGRERSVLPLRKGVSPAHNPQARITRCRRFRGTFLDLTREEGKECPPAAERCVPCPQPTACLVWCGVGFFLVCPVLIRCVIFHGTMYIVRPLKATAEPVSRVPPGSGDRMPHPSLCFAQMGYPRCRKNGGHERERLGGKARRAGVHNGAAVFFVLTWKYS